MMLFYYNGFLVGFLEKRDEISKSGNFRGPTPRLRDPIKQCRSKLRRGMFMSCGQEEAWTSLEYVEV